MKRAIYTDDLKYGFISYNENNKEILVTHPNKEIREKVRKYLQTPRQFSLPRSNTPGDKIRKTLCAVDSANKMDMALCEMYSRIGVHIDWKFNDKVTTPEEYLESLNKSISKFSIIDL